MKVLVTGAAGQLGTELCRVLEAHDVLAATRAELDLASRDSVLQAITVARPDVVVHAGAWTAVDACEGDPDRAFRVNALGTRHVAEGARLTGARVVYVSTDYVFDGEADRPYTEWDAPNPLSVYGRSKLAGERELDPGATIVRTSWVFGARGSNFVKTVLRLAAERDRIEVVADERGCPTAAPDLAATIERLVVYRLPGTFHVCNAGATSRYDFARAILAAAGHDPGKAVPVSSDEYGAPAPRPRSSVLDNAALRLTDLPPLSDWEQPLQRLVKELMA